MGEPLRKKVLLAAVDAIAARSKVYGNARDTYSLAGKLLSPVCEANLEATNVLLTHAMSKLARALMAPGHIDSWVDICGYFALIAEIQIEDNNDDAAICAYFGAEERKNSDSGGGVG